MLLRTLFTLAALYSCIYVVAQPELVHENFNNNAALWGLEKDDAHELAIQGGSLQLRSKNGDNVFVSHDYPVDPEKDFYIESFIRRVSGDSATYGIYLADTRKTKNNRWYYYLIAPDGRLIFCENSTENTEYVYYQEEAPIANPLSAGNTLGIEKKGAVTNFYFNKKLMFTLPNVRFWGGFIGYGLYGRGTIQVDQLVVKQSFKINLVPNAAAAKYTKKNLGAAVNTKDDDIMPVISADGKTLYYAVEDDPANIEVAANSDIWYATRKEDGTWAPRKNIGKPVNTREADFVINATPDNNSLLVNGMYKTERGKLNKYEGLSMTHRTPSGWSIPEQIKIENYYNYSTEVSFALSPDRQVIISSIERDITYGGTDLYVSFQQEDGTWSVPENMGSVINTYGKDITPTIAADGKTLYYSTNGKPGYGSNDIFVTKRLDDTWKNWSEPLNLGPSVNTINWDAYYSVPASGDIAYIVSNDQSLGGADIYSISMVKEAQPDPVVIVQGKVFNKATNQPIGATITYHELSNGKDIGAAQSNPQDGSYKIVLPYSKAYGFLAEKEQFLSESNNIDLSEEKPYQEIQRDLYLTPLEVGKTITLNNVFFIQSKADLMPESYPEMERLVKLMMDNPVIHIELAGHTDNVGNPALNKELSEKRVETIKNYLVSKGIAANRITGKGYGGTKPIASNASEETKKLNRRVEFTIVK
ncbi:OmpA family protein [Ohtaekwangia sp.]|uniref:OmpA family protein n=1 Tax=Ohtaekwangia sp. TaxID=2066019 RepID=UPI002FDED2A0